MKTAHFQVNHHNVFDRTSYLQLSQKVVQCSHFQILGRTFFYQSSSRKSFTFRKVFDQNLIHRYKKYKNRLRNVGFIMENKVARFHGP